MYKDYLFNATLLISFTSIIYQFFKDSGFSKKSPKQIRVLIGIIWGVLAITLMELSISLPNNVLLDFRYLPIIMAAFGSGTTSVSITGTIAILSRLLLFERSYSSYVGSSGIIVITIIMIFLTNMNIAVWKKWFAAVIASILVNSIVYNILISDLALKTNVILSFAIIFSIVSLIMFSYTHYLDTLNESYRKLKSEAVNDFLTGLNNVRSFYQHYNTILEQALESNSALSLLYIDIDFFKRVNDTYGHKEGDIALATLGEILKKSTRSMDIVSRNGGEEFSVILYQCDSELAFDIAERIRNTVEATPIILSSQERINITVSIGIASYPSPINDHRILREKADAALYEAKRTGRNKTVLATI